MTTITFKQTECVIQHQPDPPTILPPLPDTSTWPTPKPVPCSVPQAVESKAIVTLRSPRPIQAPDDDHSITIFHDPKDFWNIDLGEMLLRLGQKLLESDHGDEWLSMVQVAGLCRKYRLKWKESIKARYLEQATKDYLEKHAEIMGGGVKLECKGEFNEDKRRPELFFKFRKLYPDGTCN